MSSKGSFERTGRKSNRQRYGRNNSTQSRQSLNEDNAYNQQNRYSSNRRDGTRRTTFQDDSRRRRPRNNTKLSHTAEPEAQSGPENAVSPGTSSRNENNTKHPEIPGFYYDEEKKKYFKILPGHNSSQRVVTRQNIQQRTAEQQRVKNIIIMKEGKTKKKKTAPSSIGRNEITTNLNATVQRRKSMNVCNTLRDISLGSISGNGVLTKMFRGNISNLMPNGSRKVIKKPSHQYDKLEHMSQVLANPSQNKILCLWSVKGLLMQRIQMLNINSIKRISENHMTSIDVNPTGAAVYQSLSKITNICWAPVSDNDEDFSILYTTTSFIGSNPSVAMLRNLDSNCVDQFRKTEFGLGSYATWSCAWDRINKRFSVGSERCALLLDVQTRRMWEYFTERSVVLAQTFSKQGNTILYNGTRKGNVMAHDTRNNSTYPVQTFRHSSSISHIYHTNDYNYLIVSDYNGKIKRWDMRKRAVVHEYNGHHNEYTQIPFKVDSQERILYSAGQDCYTRLWDFNSGELLHTIPPPHPASRDNIPSLCYLEMPGKHNQIPGLLMGMLDEIHFYS